MAGIVSLVVHRRNVSFENEHSMDDQMRFAGVKSVSRIGPLTPQISPLRCAPVEMTKGRAALPATVVAEKRFSSPWAGKRPMTSPVEKLFQGRSADTADLSTTLLRSSGRDDKGEGGASTRGGWRTES